MMVGRRDERNRRITTEARRHGEEEGKGPDPYDVTPSPPLLRVSAVPLRPATIAAVTDRLRELAADLRPMTVPMGLTLARLALVPAFLALVLVGHRAAALGLFAAMAATDRLDGLLARRWGQTTALGTLLDPAADKVLVSLSMVLLAIPAVAPARLAIPWAVPLGVFLRDLGVVIGIAVVVAHNGRVTLRPNAAGKVGTTVQLALVMATLLAPEWVRLSPALAAGLLWALSYATVWTAAAAGMAYAGEGARQLRAGRDRADPAFRRPDGVPG